MERLANIEAFPVSIPCKEQLDHVGKGSNVLLKIGEEYSLMKYEGYGVETEDHFCHRVNRNVSIMSLGFLLVRTEDEMQAMLERESRGWKRYKGNIYGTHRLDFKLDHEFGIYLPSSSGRDLFLVLATEDIKGNVALRRDSMEIIIGDELILKHLQNITRSGYFGEVVVPFLRSQRTKFQVPRRKKRFFRKARIFAAYEKATRKLVHGAFVYVGCKNEVYLLGLAKDADGWPYMQGTYTTSTKPPFYFSNNYLDFISRRDAEKPRFRGDGPCNVAEYRTYDVSGFDGVPFVFPQMGREQNCKNTVFTGEPEIITGDVGEALEHFATTDFAEFPDVVTKYAATMRFMHPSFSKPNGKYYF